MLHTHTRNLDYLPHGHLIVPAGALNECNNQGCQKRKKDDVLFWPPNILRVFRAKWFEAMRLSILQCEDNLPDESVVHCNKVGRGEQALVYLGRYFYRGVLPEKNSIVDNARKISFCCKDHQGRRQIRALPGGEFLWLLLRHVLPRRLRRVRDFGLLHSNPKRLIQLLHLTLQMVVPRQKYCQNVYLFAVIVAVR